MPGRDPEERKSDPALLAAPADTKTKEPPTSKDCVDDKAGVNGLQSETEHGQHPQAQKRFS